MAGRGDRNKLLDAGRTAAAAYLAQRDWTQRRVESVTFPHVTQRVIRRQTSFDLVCPPGLSSFDRLQGVETRLLPLTLVNRWPPRIGVDLSIGPGTPVTIPASRDGDVLDAGLLIGLAEVALSREVPIVVADAIEDLTTSSPAGGAATIQERKAHEMDRLGAFHELVEPDPEIIPSEVNEALRAFAPFRLLAREILRNRILWVPVPCTTGDRCLIKLTYEVPRAITHDWRHPSSWAWVGLKVGFDMPGVGRSRSSHLDIEFPSPLLVHHARIELAEPDDDRAEENPSRQVFRPLDARQTALRDGMVISELAHERHGSFYVESSSEVQADAYVNAAVQKNGYLRGALTASIFVFATLVAYRLRFVQLVPISHRSPAITLLLFVPGLLGLLVVRPGEHSLAAGFLSGIRKLVLLNVGWPLIAAVVLVLAGGASGPTSTLARIWAGLIFGSAITTVMLLASSFLPEHELWLDDLPAARTALGAAALGLGLGLWDGLTGTSWLPQLIVLAVIPPLIFTAAFILRRSIASGRPSDGDTKPILPRGIRRPLWTVATALSVAAVVAGVVDAVRDVTQNTRRPETEVAIAGEARILHSGRTFRIRTGLRVSCGDGRSVCQVAAVALQRDGAEIGHVGLAIQPGRSEAVFIPLGAAPRLHREPLTVVVSASQPTVKSVVGTRTLSQAG